MKRIITYILWLHLKKKNFGEIFLKKYYILFNQVFGTIIYFKKGKYRKNRANELTDDNYEYEQNNNINNNILEEHSNEEKLIELINKKK